MKKKRVKQMMGKIRSVFIRFFAFVKLCGQCLAARNCGELCLAIYRGDVSSGVLRRAMDRRSMDRRAIFDCYASLLCRVGSSCSTSSIVGMLGAAPMRETEMAEAAVA